MNNQKIDNKVKKLEIKNCFSNIRAHFSLHQIPSLHGVLPDRNSSASALEVLLEGNGGDLESLQPEKRGTCVNKVASVLSNRETKLFIFPV